MLRLLETLQIAFSESPKLEITPEISNLFIELIRALIGYPPDVKIIARVFDFCCAMHPPAQAYVTNTTQKFYFYPQFARTNNLKSIQNKIERSQSAGDVFDEDRSDVHERITQPKRIRTQSEITFGCFSEKERFPLRTGKHFTPRELFGPESLAATPTDGGDMSQLDEQFFDMPTAEKTPADIDNSDGYCESAEDQASCLKDWEVLRRTDSGSENASTFERNPGRTSLIVGFFEVLRHAVVLLPDGDLTIILNDEVLDWQSLIVLTNNPDDEIRVAILRLLHSYLERAPQQLKMNLIKNRGFLLLANQLYQYKTTQPLIQAALVLITGPTDPLIDISNVGIAIKDIDATVLPAVAPLLSLIENSLFDDILCDDLCWSIKDLFESHSEIGDTMLDRGLSIVLTNSIARQTECSKPISQGLLSLLHSIVDKCCTTNTEHFAVVQDIIDALSFQEMKLHDIDDSFDDVDRGVSKTNEICDDCYKINELLRILFSVYWVAIEALLSSTELAVEKPGLPLRSSSLFAISEKPPSTTTSTPRKDFRGQTKSHSNDSLSSNFKIPESEITSRLSQIVKNSISRIQYQGQTSKRVIFTGKGSF